MPIQDYCPYCNNPILIPDGIAEVTCGECGVVLELDPGAFQEVHGQTINEHLGNAEEAAPDDDFAMSAADFTAAPQAPKESRPTAVENDNDDDGDFSISAAQYAKSAPPVRPPRTKRPKKSDKPSPKQPTTLLNFVSDEEDDVGAKASSPKPPLDLSKVKIATPVTIDTVTGLMVPVPGVTNTSTGPVPPQTKSGSAADTSDDLKILSKSHEFKIEKDNSLATKRPTQVMQTNHDDSVRIAEEARRIAEEQVREMTVQAQRDAEEARRELDAARERMKEEMRKLAEESEKARLQTEQQLKELQEQTRLQAASESRRIAEEAERQALASRKKQAIEIAKRKAKIAAEGEAKNKLLEAKQKAKEEVLRRAKEAAKKRLIAEAKQKVIERARQKVAQPQPAPPQASDANEKTTPGAADKKYSGRKGNKKHE